jgi:hypothetical protein
VLPRSSSCRLHRVHRGEECKMGSDCSESKQLASGRGAARAAIIAERAARGTRAHFFAPAPNRIQSRAPARDHIALATPQARHAICLSRHGRTEHGAPQHPLWQRDTRSGDPEAHAAAIYLRQLHIPLTPAALTAGRATPAARASFPPPPPRLLGPAREQLAARVPQTRP